MIVLTGPTCTGKTSLAIEICKKFNGEIVSADSRQIYKDMDIGTGKLPLNPGYSIVKNEGAWEIDGVKIWGYDLALPDQNFSAYDYALFAIEKIKEIRLRRKTPILAGGTGFYIDVVTGRKKLTGSKPDYEKRAALETTPTANLLSKLKELNPEKYNQIDRNNRRRVIRALEIELNGVPNKNVIGLPEESHKIIRLIAPREILYTRVDKWVEEIWRSGLIEETKTLSRKYPESNKIHNLIYHQANEFLNERLTLAEAIEQTRFAVHAYIRRQETWFRQYREAILINIAENDLSTKACNLVESLADEQR